MTDTLDAIGIRMEIHKDRFPELNKLENQCRLMMRLAAWIADYPDGDNYLAPFMRDGGFFQNGYSNKEVDDALDTELKQSDETKRTDAFGVVQDAEAKDVPLIPLWEGKQIAAIKNTVSGVEKTFDPAFQFRFWLVTKKES